MDKIKTSLLIGIVASLTLLSGVVLTDDNVYYCEARSLVAQCDKLSSTSKTCYREDGNKLCYEGWIEVENDFEATDIQISTPSAKEYLCNNKECIIKEGEIK